VRIKFRSQYSLFDQFGEHKIGKELQEISKLLDSHPEIYDIAAGDLMRNCQSTGREGMSVESAVRCAIFQKHRQLTYQELAFALEDSRSCEAFARVSGKMPKKSSLQSVIGAISAKTWEAINRTFVLLASVKDVENGKVTRTDSTVIESHIAHPRDSQMLFSGVRVMVRLLKQARRLNGGSDIDVHSRLRRAKKRHRSIPGKHESKRRLLYKDLIKVTREQLQSLKQAYFVLSKCKNMDAKIQSWFEQVSHFEPLILNVIDQAERRIIKGEKVPAAEKIVSLFEPHANIIVKAPRQTQYGHKLNVTTGKSNMIIDAVIESGNPADSSCFIPMVERQIDIYGAPPDKVSADGGYASRDNLNAAKALGVRDVGFHKKRGLMIEDMVKSKWIYRQLRNFRAGVEANISWLKRSYGLRRCNWKGLERFKSYVWSSIVTYNLVLLARASPG